MKPSAPTPNHGASPSSAGDDTPLRSIMQLLGHRDPSVSRMRPAVWKASLRSGLCPAPPSPPPQPQRGCPVSPNARMRRSLGARNTPAVCPKPPYHQHDVSLSRVTAHPEPSCKMRKTCALLDATRSGCHLIPR